MSEVPVEAEVTRHILILFHGVGSAPHASISRSLVQDLINDMGGVCSDPIPNSQLDVWLESPGGDAHAAYKLAIFLRSRYTRVNFVIPDYAKSAATLLALAGDEIFMASCAELGPLDTQEVREGEAQFRSALDTSESIENLYSRAIDLATFGGGTIVSTTRLSREKALLGVLDFTSNFMRPLLEQLDPLAINAAATNLNVTLEYGVRLLERTGEEKEDLRQRVANLVSGYPTHGFVIDLAEAQRLQLPVRDVRSYDLREKLVNWYDLFSQLNSNIIRLMTIKELLEGIDDVDETGAPCKPDNAAEDGAEQHAEAVKSSEAKAEADQASDDVAADSESDAGQVGRSL